MSMKMLQRLVKQRAKIVDDIVNAGEVLSGHQNKLKQLDEQEIPAVMEDVGIEEFKTEDGLEIAIKTTYHPSISAARKAEAFAWLRSHGHAGLIKRDVSMGFTKGEDEKALKYVEWLTKKYPGRAIKDVESVHASTLRAFVKEQFEAGIDIPIETFGIHIITKAVVKEAKK